MLPMYLFSLIFTYTNLSQQGFPMGDLIDQAQIWQTEKFGLASVKVFIKYSASPSTSPCLFFLF